MNNRNSKKKGFSLIETIVYVVLFAIVLTFLVNSVLSMSRTSAFIRLARGMNNSAVLSLERTTRVIRDSQTINDAESTFDVSPGTLSLSGEDAEGSPVKHEFFLNDENILMIEKNDSEQGPLIAAGFEVTNLIFRKIETTNSLAVKIELEIKNRAGKIQRIKNFYTTVVLRGSY